MKSLVINLTVAAFALIAAVPKAEARHSSSVYISGYRSCGTPIYTERYFVGYDHCGRPLWGYRTVRNYPPVVRRRYVAPCPPPVHCGPSRRHRYPSEGRVVIQASFGR
jgi:hypothetical protein